LVNPIQAAYSMPRGFGAADTPALPNSHSLPRFPIAASFSSKMNCGSRFFFFNRYAGKAAAMDKIVLLCALIGFLLLASELSVVAKPGPNKPQS